MESLNEHWLIIRSCNLKHLQYVNMIARKKKIGMLEELTFGVFECLEFVGLRSNVIINCFFTQSNTKKFNTR